MRPRLAMKSPQRRDEHEEETLAAEADAHASGHAVAVVVANGCRERRVDADVKSQGRSSTTTQHKITRDVTGFLLTPVDGVRP